MTKRFKEGKGCGKDINICISEEMFLIFHLVEIKMGNSMFSVLSTLLFT